MNNQERSEDEVVCGETIDHEIEIVYEDETLEQWRCLNCGAEGYNDYDEDDPSSVAASSGGVS